MITKILSINWFVNKDNVIAVALGPETKCLVMWWKNKKEGGLLPLEKIMTQFLLLN